MKRLMATGMAPKMQRRSRPKFMHEFREHLVADLTDLKYNNSPSFRRDRTISRTFVWETATKTKPALFWISPYLGYCFYPENQQRHRRDKHVIKACSRLQLVEGIGDGSKPHFLRALACSTAPNSALFLRNLTRVYAIGSRSLSQHSFLAVPWIWWPLTQSAFPWLPVAGTCCTEEACCSWFEATEKRRNKWMRAQFWPRSKKNSADNQNHSGVFHERLDTSPDDIRHTARKPCFRWSFDRSTHCW